MFSKLSNIANDINNLLVPRLCFGCNVRLYRGEQLLCTVCRNHLPLTEYDFRTENAVDRIFYGRTVIQKGAALLFYQEKGIVQNLIHALKYKGQQQLGNFLGDWMGVLLKDGLSHGPIDVVVPVPLHRKKLRERGYNQVDGFGRELARHFNAEYRDDLLRKTANTRTQTKKNRWYRWLGSQELYTLTEPGILKQKHVLLVDDVLTTGSTLEACALALKKAAGIRISIAVMAIVP